MKRPMAFRPFYPGNCREQLDAFVKDLDVDPHLPPLRAAAVPHAGWCYSGGVAARALKTLARTPVETLIILGAVHRTHLAKAAVYPRGAWETPLGDVPVDATLAADIVAHCPRLTEANAGAHLDEHAIEVLMPMVHAFFPGASVVPLMVPPGVDAVRLGTELATRTEGQSVAAVASTDLTHYGHRYRFAPADVGERAHDWMRANDRRLLELAVGLEAERIVPEADAHLNACGSGALAAAVAFARTRGAARGHILEHTDSHDVQDPTAPFDMAVGYAGLVF